jgi:hypothetical protein
VRGVSAQLDRQDFAFRALVPSEEEDPVAEAFQMSHSLCERHCGRKRQPQKRLCQQCEERQVQREKDQGRYKPPKEGRMSWGRWFQRHS